MAKSTGLEEDVRLTDVDFDSVNACMDFFGGASRSLMVDFLERQQVNYIVKNNCGFESFFDPTVVPKMFYDLCEYGFADDDSNNNGSNNSDGSLNNLFSFVQKFQNWQHNKDRLSSDDLKRIPIYWTSNVTDKEAARRLRGLFGNGVINKFRFKDSFIESLGLYWQCDYLSDGRYTGHVSSDIFFDGKVQSLKSEFTVLNRDGSSWDFGVYVFDDYKQRIESSLSNDDPVVVGYIRHLWNAKSVVKESTLVPIGVIRGVDVVLLSCDVSVYSLDMKKQAADQSKLFNDFVLMSACALMLQTWYNVQIMMQHPYYSVLFREGRVRVNQGKYGPERLYDVWKSDIVKMEGSDALKDVRMPVWKHGRWVMNKDSSFLFESSRWLHYDRRKQADVVNSLVKECNAKWNFRIPEEITC